MKKLSAALIGVCLGTALILSGCSSSSGSRYSGSYKFGTGPNKTKPAPQTSKVNLNGVGGAKISYETQRTGGCNKDYRVLGKNYMVWNGADSYVEEGIASWYGPGFHGQKTSNGEIYNQKGFTAAHKNLPLPSYLKVTNLRNGKKVIVRVNDRGPFVGTRIIDLSEGSARAIDMVGTGTAKVRIELIKVNPNGTFANAYGVPRSSSVSAAAPVKTVASRSEHTHIGAATSKSGYIPAPAAAAASESAFKSGWYIQLVACNSDLMASEIRNSVASRISQPVVINRSGNINRVLVGPLDEVSARNLASSLKSMGYSDCFVKRF